MPALLPPRLSELRKFLDYIPLYQLQLQSDKFSEQEKQALFDLFQYSKNRVDIDRLLAYSINDAQHTDASNYGNSQNADNLEPLEALELIWGDVSKVAHPADYHVSGRTVTIKLPHNQPYTHMILQQGSHWVLQTVVGDIWDPYDNGQRPPDVQSCGYRCLGQYFSTLPNNPWSEIAELYEDQQIKDREGDSLYYFEEFVQAKDTRLAALRKENKKEPASSLFGSATAGVFRPVDSDSTPNFNPEEQMDLLWEFLSNSSIDYKSGQDIVDDLRKDTVFLAELRKVASPGSRSSSVETVPYDSSPDDSSPDPSRPSSPSASDSSAPSSRASTPRSPHAHDVVAGILNGPFSENDQKKLIINLNKTGSKYKPYVEMLLGALVKEKICSEFFWKELTAVSDEVKGEKLSGFIATLLSKRSERTDILECFFEVNKTRFGSLYEKEIGVESDPRPDRITVIADSGLQYLNEVETKRADQKQSAKDLMTNYRTCARSFAETIISLERMKLSAKGRFVGGGLYRGLGGLIQKLRNHKAIQTAAEREVRKLRSISNLVSVVAALDGRDAADDVVKANQAVEAATVESDVLKALGLDGLIFYDETGDHGLQKHFLDQAVDLFRNKKDEYNRVLSEIEKNKQLHAVGNLLATASLKLKQGVAVEALDSDRDLAPVESKFFQCLLEIIQNNSLALGSSVLPSLIKSADKLKTRLDDIEKTDPISTIKGQFELTEDQIKRVMTGCSEALVRGLAVDDKLIQSLKNASADALNQRLIAAVKPKKIETFGMWKWGQEESEDVIDERNRIIEALENKETFESKKIELWPKAIKKDYKRAYDDHEKCLLRKSIDLYRFDSSLAENESLKRRISKNLLKENSLLVVKLIAAIRFSESRGEKSISEADVIEKTISLLHNRFSDNDARAKEVAAADFTSLLKEAIDLVYRVGVKNAQAMFEKDAKNNLPLQSADDENEKALRAMYWFEVSRSGGRNVKEIKDFDIRRPADKCLYRNGVIYRRESKGSQHLVNSPELTNRARKALLPGVKVQVMSGYLRNKLRVKGLWEKFNNNDLPVELLKATLNESEKLTFDKVNAGIDAIFSQVWSNSELKAFSDKVKDKVTEKVPLKTADDKQCGDLLRVVSDIVSIEKQLAAAKSARLRSPQKHSSSAKKFDEQLCNSFLSNTAVAGPYAKHLIKIMTSSLKAYDVELSNRWKSTAEDRMNVKYEVMKELSDLSNSRDEQTLIRSFQTLREIHKKFSGIKRGRMGKSKLQDLGLKACEEVYQKLVDCASQDFDTLKESSSQSDDKEVLRKLKVLSVELSACSNCRQALDNENALGELLSKVSGEISRVEAKINAQQQDQESSKDISSHVGPSCTAPMVMNLSQFFGTADDPRGREVTNLIKLIDKKIKYQSALDHVFKVLKSYFGERQEMRRDCLRILADPAKDVQAKLSSLQNKCDEIKNDNYYFFESKSSLKIGMGRAIVAGNEMLAKATFISSRTGPPLRTSSH